MRAKVGPAVGCAFVVLGVVFGLFAFFVGDLGGALSGLLTFGLGVTVWYLNSTVRRLESKIERLEGALSEGARSVPPVLDRDEEPSNT